MIFRPNHNSSLEAESQNCMGLWHVRAAQLVKLISFRRQTKAADAVLISADSARYPPIEGLRQLIKLTWIWEFKFKLKCPKISLSRYCKARPGGSFKVCPLTVVECFRQIIFCGLFLLRNRYVILIIIIERAAFNTLNLLPSGEATCDQVELKLTSWCSRLVWYRQKCQVYTQNCYERRWQRWCQARRHL